MSPFLSQKEWSTVLAYLLEKIVENDTNYDARYPLVIQAASLALRCGYEVGFRIDPDEPEWPVVFIELPTGQISWHMPQHVNGWDGHDTPTKFERIKEYIERVAGPVNVEAPDSPSPSEIDSPVKRL